MALGSTARPDSVLPTPSPATPITVDVQGSTEQGVTLDETLVLYAQSADGAKFSFKVKDQPQHGLLTIREDGAFWLLLQESSWGWRSSLG